MCATASDEQYDCMQGQQKCRVDVPPYMQSSGSVTEDWDSGMNRPPVL